MKASKRKLAKSWDDDWNLTRKRLRSFKMGYLVCPHCGGRKLEPSECVAENFINQEYLFGVIGGSDAGFRRMLSGFCRKCSIRFSVEVEKRTD